MHHQPRNSKSESAAPCTPIPLPPEEQTLRNIKQLFSIGAREPAKSLLSEFINAQRIRGAEGSTALLRGLRVQARLETEGNDYHANEALFRSGYLQLEEELDQKGPTASRITAVATCAEAIGSSILGQGDPTRFSEGMRFLCRSLELYRQLLRTEISASASPEEQANLTLAQAAAPNDILCLLEDSANRLVTEGHHKPALSLMRGAARLASRIEGYDSERAIRNLQKLCQFSVRAGELIQAEKALNSAFARIPGGRTSTTPLGIELRIDYSMLLSHCDRAKESSTVLRKLMADMPPTITKEFLKARSRVYAARGELAHATEDFKTAATLYYNAAEFERRSPNPSVPVILMNFRRCIQATAELRRSTDPAPVIENSEKAVYLRAFAVIQALGAQTTIQSASLHAEYRDFLHTNGALEDSLVIAQKLHELLKQSKLCERLLGVGNTYVMAQLFDLLNDPINAERCFEKLLKQVEKEKQALPSFKAQILVRFAQHHLKNLTVQAARECSEDALAILMEHPHPHLRARAVIELKRAVGLQHPQREELLSTLDELNAAAIGIAEMEDGDQYLLTQTRQHIADIELTLRTPRNSGDVALLETEDLSFCIELAADVHESFLALSKHPNYSEADYLESAFTLSQLLTIRADREAGDVLRDLSTSFEVGYSALLVGYHQQLLAAEEIQVISEKLLDVAEDLESRFPDHAPDLAKRTELQEILKSIEEVIQDTEKEADDEADEQGEAERS